MGFRCYTQNTNICFHNLATIPMSPSPQPSSPPPPPNLITPHRSTRWPAQTATSLAVSPGHPQHPQKRVSRRSRFLVRYSIRIILSCALAAIGLVSLVSTSGPTDALTVWPFASRVDLDLRARQASQLEFLHAGGSMGYLR